MKFSDLKISTQLMLGFSAMLLFVMVLGVISYRISDKISEQGEIMYKHPLQVRTAIGAINADVLSMRLATRNMMLATTDKEKQDALQLMDISEADAHEQFDILFEWYLGPRENIEDAHRAFINWVTVRQENTRLTLAGNIDKVKANSLPEGMVGHARDILLDKIKVIDDFARNKATDLYNNSITLNQQLNQQLYWLLVSILLLSVLIIFFLLKNIRKPLSALTAATHQFHEGDLTARSSYQSANEFGALSDSFNAMAESVASKVEIEDKVNRINSLMQHENDLKVFFGALLENLSAFTASQMAAVYMLSADKEQFEHFESMGLGEQARQSFSARQPEGEFAAAVRSRKVQWLKTVLSDCRFIFHTISGSFIPREIITLPVLANNEVVGIISLASINSYQPMAFELMERVHLTLCARIEGILSYQRMKELSRKLSQQNNELEAQKSELSAQSSELSEQNTELELQKQQLDQANQLKSTFLSNMSHELRTPLNSVIALSGVLNRKLRDQIPADEYSYLEVIERNGKHLLALINDILDLSRIESGREEIEISSFKLCHLVDEVVSMIKPQADQKNILLSKASGDCDKLINSDEAKCRHILQNLIGNSVKFTEQGEVSISVHATVSGFELVVKDTGIGISEEHQAHIFDEFRQADGSTSRKYGGTGLGLAIASKYAKMLGGKITVKSSLGNGSEFTLSLPLHFDRKNTPSKESESIKLPLNPIRNQNAEANASTGKTILLVDDSEPSIIQLSDILLESGYQIMVAANGAEALAEIDQTIPDAIILDLMMPGIDGFMVLESIRNAESTASIPVLVLTAKQITKNELRSLKRNNVYQLIQKGDVNRRELLQAVAGMVFPPSEVLPKPDRQIQELSSKPVVLVVEDNEDNMLTVKAILSEKFELIEATNGTEAIHQANKHRPHLILMDIALPVMDGIGAFQAIRSNSELKHIPIIALTASAMTSDRETILAHGFDAYVAKPIDELVLFKTINQTLYGK